MRPQGRCTWRACVRACVCACVCVCVEGPSSGLRALRAPSWRTPPRGGDERASPGAPGASGGRSGSATVWPRGVMAPSLAGGGARPAHPPRPPWPGPAAPLQSRPRRLQSVRSGWRAVPALARWGGRVPPGVPTWERMRIPARGPHPAPCLLVGGRWSCKAGGPGFPAQPRLWLFPSLWIEPPLPGFGLCVSSWVPQGKAEPWAAPRQGVQMHLARGVQPGGSRAAGSPASPQAAEAPRGPDSRNDGRPPLPTSPPPPPPLPMLSRPRSFQVLWPLRSEMMQEDKNSETPQAPRHCGNAPSFQAHVSCCCC